MIKNYVIDTNVLVHSFHAFYNLLNGENKVIIPMIVLEELDNLKTKLDDVGVNARHSIRCIETEIVNKNQKVKIITSTDETKKPDNQILDICLKVNNPILVSKDICLRTKARSCGITVEDYKKDKVDSSSQFTGINQDIHNVTTETIDDLFKNKSIESDEKFYENESVILTDESNLKNKAITIYKKGTLNLINNKITSFGLTPANLEQVIALNHLLDPNIKLVTLSGRAGSGKTLLAIAAALEMVLEQNYYNKFTVARPIMPFQKDLGFLPGDIDEKLSPWLMPIVDNLDFLFQFGEQPKTKKTGKISAFEELKAQGVIEICPLTYIRGRSIPKQFIVIDESSNISASELRTILTRVGKDTKIVLTGDYSQIDSPYLSADTNGLVYCVDKFKDQSIAAHITFSKCERSELATIADEIL